MLGRSLRIRPGGLVTVESWSHALPWALALVLEARRRGAEAILVVEEEETFFRSLSISGRPVPRAPSALADHGGAHVYLGGPEAFVRLQGLAPREEARALVRHDAAWARRASRARLRSVRLRIADVTSSAAHRYAIDLNAWQREVLRATLVDPERLARGGAVLARALARAHRVRVRHPNGTDLSADLRRGSVRVDDGRVLGRGWTSLPAGLVGVDLTEGSAQGTWEANRPTYRRTDDPSVSVGGRFVFARGRLRAFSFDRGGEAFARAHQRGGPRGFPPTTLTIGLNDAVDRAPEFGELGHRAVGLVLGRGPAQAYRTTLTGARVDLDGAPWWSDGRLVAERRVRAPRRPLRPTRRR